MMKVYDSKFSNILTNKSDTAPNDKKIYQGRVKSGQPAGNTDTGRFANKYNPDKPMRPNSQSATQYRNQGYSGKDLYNADQRKTSYEKWEEKGSPLSNSERKAQQSTQIGRVSSSWLDSLGYNTDTGEAVATFKGVNAEFFYKISYERFLSWLNSPSKGKWLHDSGIMHDYTVRGGTARKGFENRIRGLYKTKNGKRMGSNGTTQAKARVRKYLEKYR